MDDLAEMIGAKPNFFKMAITDPKLFWFCMNKTILSYQYRLVGPHNWPGARDAILTFEERILAPLNASKKKMSSGDKSFITQKKILLFVAASALGLAISKNYVNIFSIKQSLQFPIRE